MMFFTLQIGKQYLENVNPANGRVISMIPDSSKEDVEAAVLAAKNAMNGPWGETTLDERSKICNRIAELINERMDDFVLAESLDTGI